VFVFSRLLLLWAWAAAAQRLVPVILLLVGVALPLNAQTEMPTSPADQRFREITEAWWEESLRLNPLLATSTGDHRWNDRLPEVSLEAARSQLSRARRVLAELDALPVADLHETQRLNHEILSELLRHEIAEAEYRGYLMPITNREGFHVSFPELRREMPFKTADDYRNYITRLRAFPDFVRGHVELLREGVAQGITLPSVVLQRYREPLEAHIVTDPARSLFHEPFTTMPDSIPEDEQARLREEGRRAILEGVSAGYQAFLDFMEKEYVPNARGSIGAAAMPSGREFYQHRVRKFTTLEVTPAQVHQTGLAEVQRIADEMRQVMKQVGFAGSIPEFAEKLRQDTSLHADTAEELLSTTALILKRIEGELPKLFRTLPRTPFGLLPIPDYIAPSTTAAYYMPPPGDGSRAGYYYLNTYDLKSRPKYNLEALSMHEAVPGHHLQIALQQELGELPDYRRFADFTAFIEGWALYSERLGLEMGFYREPYSNFGRLTFEMWRACRLVVDTGMHDMGWTREQSIQYLVDHTALAMHDIRAEVDRYIAWPGQAVAYKMGELKIRELRERAEKQLGSHFNVREFHDVVLLHGAIPLDVLERHVVEWIATKNAQP
jgi:uncharacterized protein (DUF885 family)